MAVITTEKLGARVGAEVFGVDAERLLEDDTLPAMFLEALEACGVLVLRGMHLDDAAQVAFCRKLGPVECLPNRAVPEVTVITLDPAKSPIAQYLNGTFDWHIDGTTDDVPNKATLLTARTVAAAGGETEFASTYAAYDSLDEREKERFARLRVVHSLAASQRRHHPDPTPEQLAAWQNRPVKEHPLVWQHRSGRRSLVLGVTASHVVGMSETDGRELLEALLDRATEEGAVYRHRWEVGDMVIWDNCGVLHRVCPYDTSSEREMHRSIILGDEAIR